MHRAILPGEQGDIVDYGEPCPYCNEEVLIALDAEDHGYSVTCPFCGAEIMLCTLCLDDGSVCDWNNERGCFRQKKGE